MKIKEDRRKMSYWIRLVSCTLKVYYSILQLLKDQINNKCKYNAFGFMI